MYLQEFGQGGKIVGNFFFFFLDFENKGGLTEPLPPTPGLSLLCINQRGWVARGGGGGFFFLFFFLGGGGGGGGGGGLGGGGGGVSFLWLFFWSEQLEYDSYVNSCPIRNAFQIFCSPAFQAYVCM